jgi:hypothetical protein
MSFPAYFITCAELTVAYIVLQLLLAHLHGAAWSKIHASRYETAIEALPTSPHTSFVNPWAVERLPNPVIFPALFAVYAGYSAVRAAIGTHVNDDSDTRIVVKEQVEDDAITETCEKCGLAFRTRGLLRYVIPSLDLHL